jgi:D-alanyl-D-alanine carboxypeptidase
MHQTARRFFSALALAAACLTAGGLTATAKAQVPYLQLPANEPKYAAVVVDANTGEVLYAKRADSPRYPASITKVMTLYLAYEALAEGRLKMTDQIDNSPRAAAQAPTKLGLRPGDTNSVDDALRAMAVKYANDIAVAMAEKIGGTETRFAALMTLRGQELGMTNTRFVNASGLPDSRQITTARDLAVLSRAVMRDYPQYYSYFSLRQFAFRGQAMNNHNRLLGQMPGVDGLKTGYTNASGYNLAASAVRDGRRLIAVVLGGSSTASRDDNVEDLLLTGFNVMKRRAMGEKITVAQNMFEPEQSYSVMRPSIEQGDGEQAGIKVELTNNPSAGAQYAVQTRMSPIPDPISDTPTFRQATSFADQATPKKKKKNGGWAVQVGAFKQKAQARTHLSAMSKRFGRALSEGDGQVASPVGGFYRVRYVGMSQDEARSACKALKAKKQSCMVTSN